MTESVTDFCSRACWAGLMGHDLERADLQPLEPVERGKAVRIGGGDEERTLPLTVEEHPPDVLGPRFIDEIRDGRVIRHAVPGPARDEWTDERLEELAALVDSEPFRVDPVAAIAEGDDWVAWMTRNRVLDEPAPGDDALRKRFVGEIVDGQQPDGSWGAAPATAFAVLNLLALGEAPSCAPIRRAADWLLALPEPPPRPGMWMLTPEYLGEWTARRKPKERRHFAPGEFHWEPPDDAINYFCWHFSDAEQDQFRNQAAQQVAPTCARHHPPACEPRMTHVSGTVAEALLRCGRADHPRLRRYVNTVFHLGGEYGYWCGCGALGLFDSDIPASEETPDLNVRRVATDGQHDLSPWRWISKTAQCARLAVKPDVQERATHLEPFRWYRLPGAEHTFALIGSAWQNGDCWVKTNRAVAQHPSRPGSLAEHLAIFQASRYQTSLGEWDQGYPAGMLALLSLYDEPAAKALVLKTVPWLRAHQSGDGLWHHEDLPRSDWGRHAHPPSPRLATYHIVAALNRFGLLDQLRT